MPWTERGTLGGRPKRVRRATLCNGGLSGTVSAAQTLSSWSGRIPVQFPETTLRWRWRSRAFNTWGGISEPPIASGTGLVIGRQDTDQNGIGTGDFVGGAATTLVGGHAIPNDGAFYTSPWFDTADVQFQGGVTHLVGTGWTGAGSASRKTGWGRVFQYANNATAATTPATGGGNVPTGPSGVPLEWFIEYDTLTSRGVWLWVGDSISEGVSGPKGASQSGNIGSPLHMNYPNLWAARANALVTNISLAGIAAANFGTSPQTDPFTRVDLVTPEFDGLVLALGSNDASTSASLATWQSNMRTTMDRLTSYMGRTPPVYFVNVTPRSLASTPENIRISYNNFLGQQPWGARAIIDLEGEFNSASNAMNTQLTSDTIHLSYTGLHHAAAAVRTTLGVSGYPT